MNEEVKRTMEQDGTSKKGRGKYNDYTAEERAKIGKYAAENGPLELLLEQCLSKIYMLVI